MYSFIYLFMHFIYSLCSVLFTYTQPCEHYRVHLNWVQVKTPFWGAIRDNRILVLVHSTKRESASLPMTGVTKGASQKWYHAYKNDNRITARWWKTVKDPLHGQALNGDRKTWRRFCVVKRCSTWTSLRNIIIKWKNIEL